MNKDDQRMTNANILLLHAKDSSLVKGFVTSKEGQFSFEKIPAGDYLIACSFTGFKQIYSSIIAAKENEIIEVPGLKLIKKETALKAVTVITRKPLFEQKTDRMVINVAASITSAGSTALDVLERSPGIVVDRQNNSIAINGKNGVFVMINGKISHMPIEGVMQMLASMSSDNIERIELITTPPANFDAEGNAGYINIVLKSNNQYGTNGSYSVTGGYSNGEISNGSVNFNHRKNKINLYGDYSFTRRHMQQQFSFYHAINDQGKLIENFSNSLRDPVERTHSATVGLDVDLSKKTIVGGLFSVYDRKWTMDAENTGTLLTNQHLDTTVYTSNKELHTLFDYTANLNIHHDYKEGERLSVNFDYIYYRDRNPVSYVNSYYNGNNNFLYEQQVKSSKLTPISFWIAMADYTRKLGKKTVIEAGIKGTLSKFNNNVQIERLEQTGWTKDGLLSNEYQLNEDITAAYSSFNFLLSDKISMKMGLRYEYTNSNLGSSVAKNIVDRHYGNLFPSFFLTYKVNEEHSGNFSYSRRITRPTFNDMAPFVIFIDPNTYFSGNPALQPSITDAVNLAYSYKRTILTFSYSYEASPITNFSPKVDPQTHKETLAAENQDNRNTFSISLSLPIDITKWWSMQNNIAGISQQLNGIYNQERIQLKQKNFSVNSTQSFKLPKDYSVVLSGFYYSAGLFGIYKSNPFGSLDLGLQKKWARSSFRFNGANILNTLIFKPEINLPDKNLVTTARLQFSYPGFRLTYTHNFGNAKVKQSRSRITGAEEEKNRVQ